MYVCQLPKIDSFESAVANLLFYVLKLALFAANNDTIFFATISPSFIPTSNGDAINFDQALFNPGGHYNTTEGAYTAPMDGYYQRVF